jgi:LysR family transcriptional regulator, glycine cleavage system transcriptional activator
MHFRDLPPLHFLPAFEAAGRLGSFKAAAAELHLTPSAISQQLKAIEDVLGIALFERRGRAIRLTAAGALYLRDTQHVLSEISGATRRVRRQASGRVLRLSTADFIAYEFILPRLSLFRARFPGLELSLEASNRVIDFATSDIDVAIRIADGTWPGLISQVIGDAWIAPVCSHALAKGIRSAALLRKQTLIELRGQERRGWQAFMKKQGVREREQPSWTLLAFDSYLETMRAAEQGLGVAFGIFPMTTEWVTSGRLAVPLPVRVPFTGKICCLYRKADAVDRLYSELASWLREQYAALPSLASGRIVRTRSARGA